MRTHPRIALGAAAILAVAEASSGATLSVEAWGQDSPTCGKKSDPCATPSQAVANASPGSRILVGPGVYAGGVLLDKDGLKLESVAGARATVLQGGNLSAVVVIDADGVRLGKARRGFTLRLGPAGLRVIGSAEKARITDMRAVSNTGTGFVVRGTGHELRDCVAIGNSGAGNISGFSIDGRSHELEGNRSIGNDAEGFRINAEDTRLEDNLARDNGGHGFSDGSDTTPGGTNVYSGNAAHENAQDGFRIGGFRVLMQRNIAARNVGVGFRHVAFARSQVLIDNLASGNGLGGFAEENGPRSVLEYRGNTAVDNGGDGFFILTDDEDGVDGVGFEKNSSYGNTRCGLVNASGGPLTTEKTWWGTPEPVGAATPTVGFDFCLSGGGSVLPDPSSRPHRLKVKGDL